MKKLTDKVPTFLSVDVDFFLEASSERVRTHLDALAYIAQEKNIPITAVMNHHQMLKAVSNSCALRLINIDAHSDLALSDCDRFNCGTWVSYVKWRKKGEYVWIRNIANHTPGECGYCFDHGHYDEKTYGPGTDWLKVHTHCAGPLWNILAISRMNLKGISVCLSPSFCFDEHIKVFHSWRKRHKVPYCRGLMNEDRRGNKRYISKKYSESEKQQKSTKLSPRGF